MPRIRTIKPEFPQSETIGRLTRDARLLFLQLFTLVDDEGRARAAPALLASLLYPYDDDAPGEIERWLAELTQVGIVACYAHGGARFLTITHWREHQKIDRPTPSRLPPPGEREVPANDREASRDLAPDQEGIGTPESDSDSDAAPECEDSFAAFWSAYPRRGGANPREPARKKFTELVRAGIDANAMIAAARRLAAELAADGTAGTRFVPQALTFLAQQRFNDTAPPQPSTEFDITEAVKLYARTAHWSRFAGPAPGLPGCRASPELLARFGLAPDGRTLSLASQKDRP